MTDKYNLLESQISIAQLIDQIPNSHHLSSRQRIENSKKK